MPRKHNWLDLPAFPDLSFETKLWQQDIHLVAGLDEAGRGAWAGPVSAAAVILPMDSDLINQLNGVQDSKLMTIENRAYWAEVIKETALCWSIAFASHEEIDHYNILGATRLAMLRAVDKLTSRPMHLLLDALRLPQVNIPQTPIVKGDRRSLSIAAASVLAKTARDAWMIEQDSTFPDYGFLSNKGYGTIRHQQALRDFGPCDIHRKSYRPLREGLFDLDQFVVDNGINDEEEE